MRITDRTSIHLVAINAAGRVAADADSAFFGDGSSMRDTLKILLVKVRLDDTAAVKSLLLPIQNSSDLVRMLSERQSGISFVYEEESRIGRFVASNGVTVMSFSITGITRGQAVSIAEECEQIAVWDMLEIRKATDRALSASFDGAQ
jgi:hypothetical protein